MSKKELGQFYTKNAEYITQGLKSAIPEKCEVVDPFSGEWDLLNIFDNPKKGYDIEPKNNFTIKRDTLEKPLDYSNSWVITNPPYLARNKTKNKKLFDEYQLDDLYKIALKTIIGCNGGIIVLPINFFSSLDSKIRKFFLSNYLVKRVNVFTEQAFKDTTYTICAFSFVKSKNEEQNIPFYFFPENEIKNFTLKKNEDFTFGKEIYDLNISKVKVGRLQNNMKPNTNMFLQAIDKENSKINLSIKDEYFFGKSSDRSFATIVLSKNYSIEQQEKICELFNKTLNDFRSKYNSLFLSNYRDRYRKRISFSLAYYIISHCIYKLGY